MLQDIELLESESIFNGLRFPHKIKKVTQIVITDGQLSCLVDFRMWSLKAPAVALFLPGQVVESIELDEDFKTQREIGFYADKLCVTSKYLSTMLKQETGMTALDWIEKHVVLYAKSCLSSTSMSIQEISDELDFPSQSVFGKYFKRVEGMSPKAYRQSLSKD